MYQEPRQFEAGGCGETLLLIRIAFGILLPILGAIAGAIFLVFLFFVLFDQHPLLGLIPIGILAAAVLALVIRDRRLADRRTEEIERRPPGR